jgi:hypothetical protein
MMIQNTEQNQRVDHDRAHGLRVVQPGIGGVIVEEEGW